MKIKFSLSKLLFAAGIMACTGASAQQENVDTAIFGMIRRAELQNSHIPQIAHNLTDVAGPRLTNSPGFLRAANWAIGTMQGWGLVNAKLEPWGEFGQQWELNDFSMSMRIPYTQPVRAYAQPWSTNTPGTVQGDVVLITPNKMIDLDYIKQHVAEWKGKFLLVTGKPEDTAPNFKPSAERLADTALANIQDTDMLDQATVDGYKVILKKIDEINLLIARSGMLAYIDGGSKNTNGTVFVQSYSGYKNATVPKVSMALEDAQKIKRLILSGHPVQLALNIQATSSTADTKGYNVIAEIPGSDPTLKAQLVILGGHLDSWQAATGATDNAAGCIVMMEAVRLLDSLHLKPKRTIRIVLWSGEEEGLLGSFGYAKNHLMDPKTYALKPEQALISAYFNLDNGTGKIRGIFTQNNTAVKPIFEQWLAPFNDLGAATVTTKNTGSTDHLSFDWAGVPGFEFLQDPIDYETRTHHSNLDDYDHLQIEDLKQASIIVAAFVYQASIRPDMLPRKHLVKEHFVFDGL